VQADVFLLTDTKPNLLAGGRGLTLDRNEPANASLLSDIRSDKHMGWIPAAHVVHVPAARRARPASLDYDLAISTKPGAVRRSPTPG
jgi:hypothetical protein